MSNKRFVAADLKNVLETMDKIDIFTDVKGDRENKLTGVDIFSFL